MDKRELNQKIEALTAMAANLTPYLYEDELFGHLGDRLPKLTVGGLLMRLHQLEHLKDPLSPDQQTRIHDARINFEEVRNEWAIHYEEKVQQELQSRLNAILWYLEDCARDERSCASGWRNEAEKRTIVAHLEKAARDEEVLSDDLRQKIDQVDNKIRRFFETGDFIWDEQLEGAYPQKSFWWLYGTMRDASD